MRARAPGRKMLGNANPYIKCACPKTVKPQAAKSIVSEAGTGIVDGPKSMVFGPRQALEEWYFLRIIFRSS